MIKVNDENFLEFTNGNNSIVQFSADWCGPCKVLTSTLKGVSDKNPDVSFGKLNIDEHAEAAATFMIRSIPVLVFFEGGKEKARIMGAQSAAKIQKFIDDNKG